MRLAWARTPVTRVRAASGGEDQYGEPLPGVEDRASLPAGLFAPTGTDLPISAGTAGTVTNPVVYWPGEWPDVKPGDVLVIDGDDWRVDGRPQSWPMGLVVPLTGVETTREV